MPLIDHFNLVAPLYDRVIRFNEPQKLIELIDLPNEGLILDAGGGTGRIAQFLNGDKRRVVIADLSEKMLVQAGLKQELDLVCSESERLPFLNGTFDRVVMVDALHHVADQQQTITELWRVLKKGGRILIEEPDIRRFSVKMLAVAEKVALMRTRIIPLSAIAALFPSDQAEIRIEAEGHIGWVAVEKTGA